VFSFLGQTCRGFPIHSSTRSGKEKERICLNYRYIPKKTDHDWELINVIMLFGK
jgi:hypothetical protein